MDLWLLLFPVSGVVIGFITAWFFSFYLFRPLTPFSFLGISCQGYLPARKAAITTDIASKAAREVSAAGNFLSTLSNKDQFDKLLPVIEDHIDDFLRNRLKTAIPMIGMMIGDRTINQLKTVFMAELENILPGLMSDYLQNITSDDALIAAIENALQKISSQTIERALRPSVTKFLCIAGVIVGLLTGIVNMAIALKFFS